MWVYIKSEDNLWTVGFYNPAGRWHPESDHDSRKSAAARVNYLNGGEGAIYAWATTPHTSATTESTTSSR